MSSRIADQQWWHKHKTNYQLIKTYSFLGLKIFCEHFFILEFIHINIKQVYLLDDIFSFSFLKQETYIHLVKCANWTKGDQQELIAICTMADLSSHFTSMCVKCSF